MLVALLRSSRFDDLLSVPARQACSSPRRDKAVLLALYTRLEPLEMAKQQIWLSETSCNSFNHQARASYRSQSSKILSLCSLLQRNLQDSCCSCVNMSFPPSRRSSQSEVTRASCDPMLAYSASLVLASLCLCFSQRCPLLPTLATAFRTESATKA